MGSDFGSFDEKIKRLERKRNYVLARLEKSRKELQIAIRLLETIKPETESDKSRKIIGIRILKYLEYMIISNRINKKLRHRA